MRIPPELKDLIREQNPLREVLADYGIEVRPDGKAFCPFHEERTPSFHVYDESNTYYCYGCGAGTKGRVLRLKDGTEITDAGSDVIAFVQNMERVGFEEACRILAKRAGIPLPDRKEDAELERMKESITERNRRYYLELMRMPAVLEYLYERGLDEEDIRKWRLGYLSSPEGAGRLVFAIMEDLPGTEAKTIGFAYRYLGKQEDVPKYKNSPNSRVYNKSHVLYGLNYAMQPIRQKGFALVVEGYFDVILAHKAGLENTVATCGTSFTEEQMAKLRRYTNCVYLWYDGDEAGKVAAVRVLPDLLRHGFMVYFIETPGEDPADFLLRNKLNVSNDILTEMAKPALHVLFDEELSRYEQVVSQERIKVLQRVLPVLEAVQNPAEKLAYTQLVYGRLGITA